MVLTPFPVALGNEVSRNLQHGTANFHGPKRDPAAQLSCVRLGKSAADLAEPQPESVRDQTLEWPSGCATAVIAAMPSSGGGNWRSDEDGTSASSTCPNWHFGV